MSRFEVAGAKGKPGPKTCEKCASRGKCLDTRSLDEMVKRRYKCINCDHRWWSYETTVTEEELEEDD